MDFQELWEQINNRVDWFIAGIIALFLVNIAVAFLLVGVYLTDEDFYQTPVGDIQEQMAILDRIPDPEDIEIPEHQKAGELPERYAELQGSELFIPLAQRRQTPQMLEEPVMNGEGETVEVKPRQPLIAGFQIVGRVIDKNRDIKIGMLKREEDGSIFIAREGEYLEGTEIKVVDIADTVITIDKPEHRITKLQFDMDKMHQELEQFIKLY
jgi:hypothetical protein